MYVGRAGSQVEISKGTNHATDKGGAIAINGSSLHTNEASICMKNTAKLGVVSACEIKVTISNPKIPATPDPFNSSCALYDCSNTSYNYKVCAQSKRCAI